MGDWIEIRTQNNLPYIFIPNTSGAVKLKVKATQSACIALTNGPFERNPMTEILLVVAAEDWGYKSVIRRDRCESDVAESDWTGLLNNNRFIELWISWQNNEIMVGMKGQPAFMKYLDLQPHTINHIGVRTEMNAVGHWKIEVSPVVFRTPSIKRIERGELRWVKKTRKRRVPPDAFIAGYENGENIYIARAMHQGSLIPGKYIPSKECVYIGVGLETHMKYKCQILCGLNASWVKTTGDQIPPHAFAAGIVAESDDDTEYLFIGRARIDGHLIPGKVHTYYKTCYILYDDRQMELAEYEILVIPDKLPDVVVRCQRQRPSEG